MSDYPYTPFPFTVTPASPPFELSPIASNISQGWAPSCSTSDCVPTASWSTSSIGATLSFQFRGWDVAFDGNVKGNMSIELFRDGAKETWNPSIDTLFRFHGPAIDDMHLQNITLKVLDASPDAELTIKQARVNGSSFADAEWDSDRWIIPSNDAQMSYTGFVQQASSVQAGSQTTYVSSQAGDAMSMQFNGSTLLIHGPCGPTNGLMKVKIDDQEATVNTSKPITSDDCLLFQAWAFPRTKMHELRVENVNGAALGINRLEFFTVTPYGKGGKGTSGNGSIVAGIVIVVVFTVMAVVVLTWKVHKKKKNVIGHTKVSDF
ncbi:P12 domain protein, putative [Rhizoctonia solani AG-3 Rhs1AP]|uniref:p12 domain protein, putative n=2 Tax=Rhizoctonia solani AG-3 TaxID=1086053 RepID=X8IZR5_9AGAM|nr:P12 domain protein, putative [Rhizoctonia solani AG-3 Rhs1AP]KEP52005.1 putative P12 domain protein [Rhizoctonia solani 123E]